MSPRVPLLAVLSSLLLLAAACGPPEAEPSAMPPLVDTAWLADRLHDPGLVLIDARPGLQEFLGGHLPGAQHLSVHNLRTSAGGVPGMILPPEVLQVLLGRLGIDRESRVIVYGAGSDSGAAFVAEVLRMAGVRRVALLDGGMERWSQEGRPVTIERQPVEETKLDLRPDPDRLASLEQVREAMESDDAVIVDARAARHYQGGHIPGAVHRYWKDDVVSVGEEDPGTYRDPERLAREYEALGISRDKEVIVYCYSGFEAAAVVHTLREILGYPRVRLYDGSWAEWIMVEDSPQEGAGGIPPEALSRARAAADALSSQLRTRLLAELDRGGPQRAVRVCSEVAQALAAGRSDETTRVRRVSLKARNPADRPDAFEEEVLYEMERARSEGGVPEEVARVVAGEEGLMLRYLRPVMVGARCLACHGSPEEIDPAVREAIAAAYPDDRAVGYRPGDLRGAVSVSVRLEPAPEGTP